MSDFRNGEPWLDTDGNVIHAHGGHMLNYGGWWYWYGENRTGNNYVSCYRTKDFKSFEFRGNIITTETPTEGYRVKTDLSLTGRNADGTVHKVNLERPKVLWCERTKKFVLWCHYENGVNYHDARCAVATSDHPDHGFVYHGSFNPFGDMARDCTLFMDGEDAYFAAASRDNLDLHVWKLTKDFMSVSRLVNDLFQNELREAPAFFKRNDRYYLLTSYCTGWAPNQGKWSSCASIDGEWEINEDFGDETTFRSQPAFVLEKDGKFIYFADRWGGKDHYNDSTYVVLEIKFREDGSPYIEYSDEAAL